MEEKENGTRPAAAAVGEAEDSNEDWPKVPCDLTPWMPMALFLQAEGNEWAVGRTREVQDMFRKAVAAAKGNTSSSSSTRGEGGSSSGSSCSNRGRGSNDAGSSSSSKESSTEGSSNSSSSGGEDSKNNSSSSNNGNNNKNSSSRGCDDSNNKDSSTSSSVPKDLPGDELYGVLAGWNFIRTLLDGGQAFSVKEVLEVITWVQHWKQQLHRWKGYGFVKVTRIQVIKDPCIAEFKVRYWKGMN